MMLPMSDGQPAQPRKPRVAIALVLVGVTVAIAGVAEISTPAAVVCAGAFFAVVGLRWPR